MLENITQYGYIERNNNLQNDTWQSGIQLKNTKQNHIQLNNTKQSDVQQNSSYALTKEN